jgi:hypothetical protein
VDDHLTSLATGGLSRTFQKYEEYNRKMMRAISYGKKISEKKVKEMKYLFEKIFVLKNCA